MFSICKNKNIYNVYSDGAYIGKIETYENSLHKQHCYLKISLERYDVSARELFCMLRKEIGRSLQVMLESDSPIVPFLLSGRFICKRKCFEVEVSKEDLAEPLNVQYNLDIAYVGSNEYDVCCECLYDYYKKTHEKVNPLTVDIDSFCKNLPETAVYKHLQGEIAHVAFIEENEIAYVATKDLNDFDSFAKMLMAYMFEENESVCFECDDCDNAALVIREFFIVDCDESFDTYILN